MTIIAKTPDALGLVAAQNQATAIGIAAQTSITTKQFVYFAAFDGTNNDRNAVYKSGSPQDTNVAQLFEQVENNRIGTGNQKWLGLSEQHFPKDKWIPSRVSAHGNAHES